ncbi:flagellar basal body rod protein FlgB [Alteromonas sp. ASW11-130]|uniref:flagellar basal body rod protein FlgB n=1 Tax=Alteromonas sp. ASW11-130 TaxID=3015775 RepID=UPI0022421833|nr:flagellar basal body rod protein FlgB [Alteromonas sp. ASW11-130]MCW8091816.1 flagellar basal body rod protein FlgB [Alteromonas sp. ASW11-130]
MAIDLDRLVGFHQKALNLREQRMELISGNIANANTPGYKAKDIDFQAAMKMAQTDHKQSMVRTDSKHMVGSMHATSMIQYRLPLQPDTGDGNSVELQQERNAFLDNGLRYQATLEFVKGKLKGMKKALSGGQGA